MHNGYAQAEGVASLDQVPETGALVIIGYPKFGGGLGGYARYIAVCPPDWPYGVTIGPQDAPLPKSDKPLHYDAAAGCGSGRLRTFTQGLIGPQPVRSPRWLPSVDRLRPSFASRTV